MRLYYTETHYIFLKYQLYMDGGDWRFDNICPLPSSTHSWYTSSLYLLPRWRSQSASLRIGITLLLCGPDFFQQIYFVNFLRRCTDYGIMAKVLEFLSDLVRHIMSCVCLESNHCQSPLFSSVFSNLLTQKCCPMCSRTLPNPQPNHGVVCSGPFRWNIKVVQNKLFHGMWTPPIY